MGGVYGMELFSLQFFSSLLSIVMIDIILGGDNAILIALATRRLPKKNRKKAIFWGVVGAIAVRVALTALAVYVLNIPLVHFLGGVFLIWIAFKLLVDEENQGNVKSGESIREAVRTIIVADLLMGLDNVLAVAGAAKGHPLLVVLGLLISIPIIVWGSNLILYFIEKYPAIIFVGAAVIAWTAGNMVVSDVYVHEYFITKLPLLDLAIPIITTLLVTSIGFIIRKKNVTYHKA